MSPIVALLSANLENKYAGLGALSASTGASTGQQTGRLLTQQDLNVFQHNAQLAGGVPGEMQGLCVRTHQALAGAAGEHVRWQCTSICA